MIFIKCYRGDHDPSKRYRSTRAGVLRYFDFGTKRKMRRSEGYAPGLLRRKQVYEMETSDFLADGCDRAALQPGGHRLRDRGQYTFRQPDGVRDLVCGSVLGGREFHGIRVFLPHAPHVGFTLRVSHDALEIGIAVGFGDLADQFAGISRGNVPGGDVFGDNASRADHDVIADMDAGQDDGISADPDVIADRDVDCRLCCGQRGGPDGLPYRWRRPGRSDSCRRSLLCRHR